MTSNLAQDFRGPPVLPWYLDLRCGTLTSRPLTVPLLSSTLPCRSATSPTTSLRPFSVVRTSLLYQSHLSSDRTLSPTCPGLRH